MPVFTALIIIITLGSITIGLISLNRIVAYNKKYHFPESKYTKLFGILTKEYITVVYLIAVGLHAVVTVWFLMTL